ncbi:hypothetical protein KQH51_03185 [bacterium]|nr:hypothetical protein [bacterium]MCB2201927.1 hypothetical protein [bacterium]
MNSTKEICEFMWALEERFDLLDWSVSGVKVWQYLRMPIYFRIAQQAGVLEKPHTTIDSFSQKLQSLPSHLKAAYQKDPLRGRQQVEALIFEHDRSREVDGQRIDIYTHYLQQELRDKGILFHTLERPHLGKHEKTDSPNRYYLDRLMLEASIRKRFRRVQLRKRDSDCIRDLEQEIGSRLGSSFALLPQIDWAVRHFHASYEQVARLFRKRAPQRIYLVVSYGQGEVIQAARDRNIETIEVQHGAFSKYHLGYSFPGRTKPLDYFPDTFYAWSDFWASMMPLPAERVVNAGFPYMEANRRKYDDVERDPNQLLVLSQGSIGEKIAAAILRDYDALSSYRIVFKLHPGEYDRRQEYPSLQELVKKPNVRVGLDEDLYALFARSTWQAGVYSTAIYEGMEFGCRTILLDLPGIEYMEHLRKRDDVLMLDEFIARFATSKH